MKSYKCWLSGSLFTWFVVFAIEGSVLQSFACMLASSALLFDALRRSEA